MIAVLDACTLYPPMLRDILMWLAAVNSYEPRWTEEIHLEWIRNILADRPEIAASQLECARRLMDASDPNAIVSGYERHIPELTLPDKDDRHVLAAAIEAKANLIVTFNLKDFPRKTLSQYGVRAIAPDAFLETVFLANQPRFLRGINQHRASLKRPPKTKDEYLSSLIAQGLTRAAACLEAFRDHF